MKKSAMFPLIALAVFIIAAGTASASNITIWDNEGTVGIEDNEVTPNCLQGQVWDLEAFWQSGNELSMIGGYNFNAGQGGFTTGDIFIDDLSNGPAVWGSPTGAGLGTNSVKSVSNANFNYDYVIHIDTTFLTYSVYALTANDLLLTAFYNQNDPSSPWRWAEPIGTTNPTPLANYMNRTIDVKTFTDADPRAVVYGVTGWPGYGDTHYLATGFDLSFLAPGTDFLAKYTYQCGNDNLIGQGTTAPVPEPATLLLLGSGLLGLAAFRRKAK